MDSYCMKLIFNQNSKKKNFGFVIVKPVHAFERDFFFHYKILFNYYLSELILHRIGEYNLR